MKVGDICKCTACRGDFCIVKITKLETGERWTTVMIWNKSMKLFNARCPTKSDVKLQELSTEELFEIF